MDLSESSKDREKPITKGLTRPSVVAKSLVKMKNINSVGFKQKRAYVTEKTEVSGVSKCESKCSHMWKVCVAQSALLALLCW